VAWSARDAAACSAARSAVWSAAWDKQNRRLARMLGALLRRGADDE
jgi:hypothetical protein